MKKVLFLLTMVLAVCACAPAEQNHNSKPQQTYTYTVVDKSKDVESRYSFFYGKPVVDTVEKLIVKDSYGNIKTIEDEKMYYKYNIGDSFKSTVRYY